MSCREPYFPKSFSRGALLLRQLSALKPGQAMDITKYALSDIEVPANPLDRQDAPYLIRWFKARLPFYCMVCPNLPEPIADKWTFYRPDMSA